MQQEVFPGSHRSRVDVVDVLVAAEPGEAIGKGDDDRWHALFADQPVEPFRQVLAEADPGRVGQAAAGETDLHAVRNRANKQPSDTPADDATDETRRVPERWGALHAGRSALS